MRLRGLLTVLACLSAAAGAQGTLKGRVRADSLGPLGGATVDVGGLTARTDSTGAFEIRGVPAGMTTVYVRAVGFKNGMSTLFVNNGQTVSHQFTLARLEPDAQQLRRVDVTGKAEARSLAPPAFYDRKQNGVGKQYDRSDLAKFDQGSLSVFMSQVPGTAVAYGGRNVAFSTTRNPRGDKCAFCRSATGDLLDPYDFARGFRPACYMDVYMNGMLVYQFGQSPPQPLFDFSTLKTQDFEAIEVYTSASNVPAQYSRTSGGCGAVLFWSRISGETTKKP
jgi:hypothetical protein